MPFSANEVLIAAKPIPGDALDKFSTAIAGDVAAKLGKLFKESYNHTRPVVLAFKLVDKQKI